MAFQKGNTPWNVGIPQSPEAKQKNALAHIGRAPANKGVPLTPEQRRKAGEFNKGRKMPWVAELNKIRMRGENNPRWKGGIRGHDYLERRRFKSLMQKIVFERDDYTCQLCGVRGVDLQVDHIQSWAEYVELRFKIENCRTLCKPCHYKITFGKPIPDPKMPWGHNKPKERRARP